VREHRRGHKMEIEFLVKLAQKGDKDAFHKLIELHKEELYKIAFSYMRNKEDALDVVGDTVFKAYLNIKKLKEPKYFRTWTVRILINNANNVLKKRKKELNILQIFRKHHSIEDKEQSIDLENAINSLDKKSRDIVILKYYNGFTLKEISEAMDCPLGTIKSNLSRSLKKLRIQLEEDGYEKL